MEIAQRLLRRSLLVAVACILLQGCRDDLDDQTASLEGVQAACLNGHDSACNPSVTAMDGVSDGENQLASAEVRKFFQDDTHRNVGKSLPSGIHVTNRSGSPMDLRAALAAQGKPMVLLRVEQGCPPCQDLLEYVRSNAQQYERRQGARIVVIDASGANADGSISSQLPDDIQLFRSKGTSDTDFLAGHVSPAAFFFDENLKLVSRRAGLTTPEDFLLFPRSSEN